MLNSVDEKLLEERIIILNDAVNDQTSKDIITKLLYLDSLNNDDISFYINTPGGSVNQGLAIIDTMNLINSNVSTICLGNAYSMGALLLTSGAKGKRYALKHSSIMIHQPSTEASGNTKEINILNKNITNCYETLVDILTSTTKRTKKEIKKYLDSDYYMNSNEAKSIGIIDYII